MTTPTESPVTIKRLQDLYDETIERLAELSAEAADPKITKERAREIKWQRDRYGNQQNMISERLHADYRKEIDFKVAQI